MPKKVRRDYDRAFQQWPYAVDPTVKQEHQSSTLLSLAVRKIKREQLIFAWKIHQGGILEIPRSECCKFIYAGNKEKKLPSGFQGCTNHPFQIQSKFQQDVKERFDSLENAKKTSW